MAAKMMERTGRAVSARGAEAGRPVSQPVMGSLNVPAPPHPEPRPLPAVHPPVFFPGTPAGPTTEQYQSLVDEVGRLRKEIELLRKELARLRKQAGGSAKA